MFNFTDREKTNEAIQTEQKGLTYNTETLENLINKDTDQDGVLDWEERLWGTDGTKKDTDSDGIPDNLAIEKLKTEQGESSLSNEENQNTENLTETDKFSRELFSTIATLSQNGEIDQATIDKLSSSLAEQIKNPTIQKIFLLSDLKIIKDDPKTMEQAVKNYDDGLNNIYKKHPTNRTVMEVLQDFIIDENNVNIAALEELDPINMQVKGIMDDLVKMSVPQSIASLHLDVINGLERLYENINNIKLFETDVVVALGAISQYQTNTDLLEKVATNLTNTIKQKLSN